MVTTYMDAKVNSWTNYDGNKRNTVEQNIEHTRNLDEQGKSGDTD